MSQVCDHIARLQTQGYTVMPALMTSAQTESLLARVRTLFDSQPKHSRIPRLNQGHDIIYSLQTKDRAFIDLLTASNDLLAVIIGVLNDPWYPHIPQNEPNFILREMLARSSGPESLPLHIDSFIPSSGQTGWMYQVSFILEDQTPDNGCTVIVPGTHRSDVFAPQDAATQPLPARAGDVVIWDSRLWHGAGANSSGHSRWSIIATLVRWWLKQHFDFPRRLPEDIFAGLSDRQKALLGFCALPPRDETDRIDMRQGWTDIRPHVADYRD